MSTNETASKMPPSDADFIIGLAVNANGAEFIDLLQVYVDIAHGLEIDQQEIKDTIYSYVAGENCCSHDSADRVWESLTMLREELIMLRDQWREKFADLEDERDCWDHLNLDIDARVKSALIGEPEGEA